MLEELLKKLCKELKINTPTIDKERRYLLNFNKKISITAMEQKPDIFLQSSITKAPSERKEEIFSHVMRGNLLGQGTGDTVIGIDEKEKFFTLSFTLPWEINYSDFRDKIEDFINYLIFWKKEIETIQLEQKIL